MLRDVVIDRKPNGKRIIIPVEVTKENREQQVKIFIEMAASSTFDGQQHISLFRHFHGGIVTLDILRAVIRELREPTVQVDILCDRSDLISFFVWQLEKHSSLKDENVGYPGDRSQLPM